MGLETGILRSPCQFAHYYELGLVDIRLAISVSDQDL